MIAWSNPFGAYHVADVREFLAAQPDESVQCVVTSPPYWGLRDYDVDGMIGLEPTLLEWQANMVDVFREVRRVLRDDGTLWLNLGDAYSSRGGAGGSMTASGLVGGAAYAEMPRPEAIDPERMGRWNRDWGSLKPKDLIGMPWRVALALQADGWWLRSDVIWAKPNPMPESVTDRPTSAHEHVFLLTKSARYYYDAEAVREAASLDSHGGGTDHAGRNQTAVWGDGSHRGLRDAQPAGESGRNLRNVWTIPTQAVSDAHFATFPENLVEPCVLAGTSAKGACSECGAPWEREVEATAMETRAGPKRGGYGSRTTDGLSGTMIAAPQTRTLGWRPTCDHDAPLVPCVVLDPFMGSGTVALVSQRLGRHWLGCDLNPEYAAIAERRAGHANGVMALA